MITRIVAEGTSTAIKELLHNDKTLDLTIVFCSDLDHAFVYFKVPVEIFDGFVVCESLGDYFNTYVYGQYAHKKIAYHEIIRKENGNGNNGSREHI